MPTIRLYSSSGKHNGYHADIVFHPYSGGTDIVVATNALIPYYWITDYYYGTFDFIFTDAAENCHLDIVPPTPTPTQTPSITPTNTVTPTVTVTPSMDCGFGVDVQVLTPTPTPTQTVTPTMTVTPTVTPTVTVTPTIDCSFGVDVQVLTPTPTPTVTNTVTPTITPTMTVTPTIDCGFGIDVQVLTPTPTPTPTQTVTPTVTPTVTITPSIDCSFGIDVSLTTPTPTPTVTATQTPTVTPTITITPTNTVTPTVTPTPSIDTSFHGIITPFYPATVATGCSNCGSNITGEYLGNDFKTDIDCLDLSDATDGDTIRINYSAYDRPNRFAIKENGISIVANSGWVGSFGGNPYVAPYAGPWGGAGYTFGNPNGSMTFTYHAGRTYEIYIDVAPASTITPISDAYTYSVLCPQVLTQTVDCLAAMEFIVRYDEKLGPCPGNHTCNRATFDLKANNVTVGRAYLSNTSGSHDNHNYPPGQGAMYNGAINGNRYNSFSLTNQQVQDISSASVGGVIQLSLVGVLFDDIPDVHTNLSWVTVKINGLQIYDGCPAGNFVKINACTGQVIP